MINISLSDKNSVKKCGKYVSVKIDCEMKAQQSSYLPSIHHVMGHVTRDRFDIIHSLISSAV